MSSSTNLYDYLSNANPFKLLLNITDDDDDLLIGTSPTVMTSSDSSDSAIVSDEIDDFDLTNEKQSICRNSWPKTMKKLEQTTFASLSQSFDILNQFKQQTIYDNTSNTTQQKYKRPLPWLNSTSSSYPHSSPSHELSSNKVVFYYLFIKKNCFKKIKKKKRKYKYLIKFFFFFYFSRIMLHLSENLLNYVNI